MSSRKTAPSLRFRGFNEPWEEKKLGEICAEIIAGGDVDKEMLERQGKYPVIANALTNDGIIGFYKNEYRVKAPAVTITGRGDVGHAKARKVDFTPVVRLLTIKTNHDVDFMENIINTLKIMVESTGVPQLTVPQVARYELFVPQTVEEEKRIGSYFEHLDRLIALEQRKYDKLNTVKKSMLEKMFPQKGAKVPEIRFKGFSDPWEEKKLGEIADIIGGGTPSTMNPDYWEGKIDWYTPAEIDNQIYVHSSQRKITKDGYANSSARLLPVGTVLFTSRAGIGKTAILACEGCTNQGFQSIVPHQDELDSYFIFSRTEELKRYGEIVGAGSTFVEVSGKQMAAMELMMPVRIEEQQAIGSYFKNLDRLITLQNRKIEKLRNLKKACLEKMFV